MAEVASDKKSEKVQCFGRKKRAVAVALVRHGRGNVRVNGCPIHTLTPDILRVKVYEPLMLLGKDIIQIGRKSSMQSHHLGLDSHRDRQHHSAVEASDRDGGQHAV